METQTTTGAALQAPWILPRHLVAMEPAKFGPNKCEGSRRWGKRGDGDFIAVVMTTGK